MALILDQYFYPMNQMPAFKNLNINNDFSNSTNISKYGISLPSSVSLEFDEIKFICDKLLSIISDIT